MYKIGQKINCHAFLIISCRIKFWGGGKRKLNITFEFSEPICKFNVNHLFDI